MNGDELFPVVDDVGNVIGKATRKECHSGSMLLHPVVHLHVFNAAGDMYLQKRSATKDIQPGKWDTSVGGHVDYGEDIETALLREAREELGLVNLGNKPQLLFRYVFQSRVEREFVNTYMIVVDKDTKIDFDPEEIDEGRFWPVNEIVNNIGKGVFTPNFEQEFIRLKKHLSL